MEELSGPLLLGILYAVFSLIGAIANRNKKKQQQQRTPRPEQPTTVGTANKKPSTFDDLLEEMRRQMEPPAPVEVPAPWGSSAPDWEEIEERETLEVEPVVASLETEPVREQRVRQLSFDEQSAALTLKRRLATEERNRAWRLADHRQFDQEIRARPPQQRRAGRLPPVTLQQAMLWHEILLPPVGLRD